MRGTRPPAADRPAGPWLPARHGRRVRVALRPALFAAALAAILATSLPLVAQSEEIPAAPTPTAEAFGDALERLGDEISRHPDRIAPRFEHARLLEAHGLVDAAMQDYRWLLNHRPELPEAYNNMARLLAGRGELSQAISLLEQGLATHPVYQLMFDNLRALYESMARQAYRAALNEPASPEQVVPANEDFSVELKGVESMDTPASRGAPAPNTPADTTDGTAASPAPFMEGKTTRMAARGE